MNSEVQTEVVAATAADENYVIPLAVTVRSAIDALGADQLLRLFILDGGITPASRGRLMQSWMDPRVRIEWIKPDMAAVQHLPISDHITLSAYLRLFLPEVLPADVSKLIYFDSDMLIRRDLGELFSVPLEDNLLLAVQEMAAPWMDSELVYDDYHRRRNFLSAARPVANYRELGIRPDAPYFNTGLLVFDADQWREQQIARQVLECLEEHREHVLWWDQYALNVVMADKWRPLDARWNQTAGAFEYPSWRESPLDATQFQQIRNDPWIVHFCSPTKPWHYLCDHPYRQAFYDTLAKTQWPNWKPPRPTNVAYASWRHHRIKFKKSFRTIKQNVRNLVAAAG